MTRADGSSRSRDVTLPARTVLVAAGTQPNTVLAREDARNFHLDGRYFQACDENGNPVQPGKKRQAGLTASVAVEAHDGRFISFFGDLHPSFFGNVVKAMGGAKQGYPVVSRVLEKVQPGFHGERCRVLRALNGELRATVHEVIRLTPNIVEVVVRAPLAAKKFRPGQFYRLQNFETLAQRRGRHPPGNGRPGAHRRLGRPRQGAGVHHRAGDGRLVRLCAHCSSQANR